MYDSGWVSLEDLLLSWHPSQHSEGTQGARSRPRCPSAPLHSPCQLVGLHVEHPLLSHHLMVWCLGFRVQGSGMRVRGTSFSQRSSALSMSDLVAKIVARNESMCRSKWCEERNCFRLFARPAVRSKLGSGSGLRVED